MSKAPKPLSDVTTKPAKPAKPASTQYQDLPQQTWRHPLDSALSRRPLPSRRILLWAVALSVLALILWAAMAEVDEVSRGQGQVIPSQRVQMVQNLEGGILREILVQEGQDVDKDHILLRIDNESAGSQYREALSRSQDHQASIARLEARINDSIPSYPPEILHDTAFIQRHNDLLASEKRKDTAEIAVLQAQKNLRELEIAESREKKKQLQLSLKLAVQQLQMARPLLQSKSFSPMEFNELQQKEQALTGEISTLELTIPRLEAARDEAQKRLDMNKAEMERTLRQEIHKLSGELASLRENLVAGSDRMTRTEVRSPVNGVVKKIHITTTGGVIRPGENIMEIVPKDDALIIEARLSPTDIAFIYPGQKATIKLSAYDFSIYGALQGVVDTISADTLEGKQGELFYMVKIRTTGSGLSKDGNLLPILPGMMAQVDILTGKKTILAYVLKPLLKAKANALTER